MIIGLLSAESNRTVIYMETFHIKPYQGVKMETTTITVLTEIEVLYDDKNIVVGDIKLRLLGEHPKIQSFRNPAHRASTLGDSLAHGYGDNIRSMILDGSNKVEK